MDDSSKRVETAFLSSLSGCILGKPLEASLTGDEIVCFGKIKSMAFKLLCIWLNKRIFTKSSSSHIETTRENISYVAPDDDINYTIMGDLEKYGTNFTHENMEELWIHHLPINTTFGPEEQDCLMLA